MQCNYRDKSLGPSSQELYSISQTKHILAGGSEGSIHFWYNKEYSAFLKCYRDLRSKKILNTFAETHGEEVTSLQFAQDKTNVLLSASLDGLVCLFDLSKGDEEEAADTGNIAKVNYLNRISS